MTVTGPNISIEECALEGGHEGTGQSDSGPCAIERSVFHLLGKRFPPGSDIVARWVVHPVSTSVGSVDPVGTAGTDGSFSANMDSRPWVAGLYEAEIYAQSDGAPVSNIVRMALRITPPAEVSMLGCLSSNPLLGDESDRCYVKRGFPFRLYGKEGGFAHNSNLVIEWLEHPDDSIDKSLAVPVGIASSAGFTVELATTGWKLGEYIAKIYSVGSDGYRNSSIVEKKLAVENPDLVYHGYMTVDELTQDKIDPVTLKSLSAVKFSTDASNMSDDYSANAVLFNPSNSDVPLEFSWENEIRQAHAKGMTAFLGVSSIFFKEG
jgi:hypothetical protein